MKEKMNMSLTWFQQLTNHNANENIPQNNTTVFHELTNSPKVEENISTTILSIKNQVDSWHQYMKKHFESEPV